MTDLKKQYNREFDMLIENLDNILSEFHLIHAHLAKMELLKKLQEN